MEEKTQPQGNAEGVCALDLAVKPCASHGCSYRVVGCFGGTQRLTCLCLCVSV